MTEDMKRKPTIARRRDATRRKKVSRRGWTSEHIVGSFSLLASVFLRLVAELWREIDARSGSFCETNQRALPTKSDDPLSRKRIREAMRFRIVGSDVDRDERKRQNGRDKERTGIMRFPPSSIVDNSGSKRERRKREEKEERRRKGDRWQKERRWSTSRGQKAPPRNFERRLRSASF